MEALLSVIGTLVTLVGSISAVAVKVALNRRKILALRASQTVIGVTSSTGLPDVLAKLPDFSSYKKAVYSGEKVVVVHFSNLSKALRLSDWVIYKRGIDNKIIDISTASGIKKLNAILESYE